MGELSPHISVKVVTKTGIITTCALNHVAKDMEWVERLGSKNVNKKLSPINEDLMTLLVEMGYDQMKGKNVKLIDPENTYTINTIMEKVSRSFTHFRKAAGIETPFTLKHLRKIYLT